MKTLYKYVEFDEQFTHNGVTYIKKNHQRGKVVGAQNKYKPFKKSDIVEADIPDNLLTSYMKVG